MTAYRNIFAAIFALVLGLTGLAGIAYADDAANPRNATPGSGEAVPIAGIAPQADAVASGGDETIVIGKGDYVVDFTNPKSARKVINKALKRATEIDGRLTVVIPKGDYHLSSYLYIWSNTTLRFEAGAKLVSEHMGATLRGAHLAADGTRCSGAACTHGGYSQIHDVTIEGAGILDCNTDLAEKGWGTFGITLRHGHDITVRGITLRHFSNHALNLSGTRDVVVENCSFENAKTYKGGAAESFWGGNFSDARYDTIEAVHLDFCNEEGEANAYPVDDTPVRNATVRNCTFARVCAGVGTHHDNVHGGAESPASGILVENCTFTNLVSGNSGLAGVSDAGAHWGCAVEFASAKGLVVRNCTADDLESLANLRRCTGVRIESNRATRCRGGIALTENSDAPSIVRNAISAARNAAGTPVADSNALYFCDGVTATLSSNVVSGAGRAGIRANGGCTLVVRPDGSAPTQISGCATHGISIGDACTATISGARIADCGEDGIVANGAARVEVKNASVLRSGKYGIGAKACSANIHGCTVTGSGNAGVYLVGAKPGSLVASSSVCASGGDGIRLEACGATTVRGNTVAGSMRDGICAFAPAGATCTATISGNTSTSARGLASRFDLAIRENCTATVLSNNKFGKRCVYLDEQSGFRQSGNRPKSRIALKAVKVEGLSAKRYNAKPAKQSVRVKTLGNFPLKKGTDFKVSYKNNVKASTKAKKARVVVKGTGLYRFGTTRTFNILRAPIGKAKIGAVATRAFSGKAFKPKPKVRWRGKTLKRGRDYVVSWRHNVAAGTAQIRIRGIGNFKGVKVNRFAIKRRTLADARISVVRDATYTGKAITPEPVVTLRGKKLRGGVDYWVSWHDNVGPGTAKVAIHGAGNYKGRASATFSIRRPSYAAA